MTLPIMNQNPLRTGISMTAIAFVSVVLERTLYARLYDAPELRQVLMTIGLVFVASAVARYFWGPLPQPLQLPAEAPQPLQAASPQACTKSA